MSGVRSAVALVLEPLRRRGRPVAWTPEFMGLGNLLQLAMWAYDGRVAGEARWIRSTPRLDPWLEVFPGLRTVVLTEDEVRFTDRRLRPWSQAARASGADGAVPLHEAVDVQAVERFLADVVLPGSALLTGRTGLAVDDALVVNVRRGDYYSNPEIRRQYGFDLVSYVRAAVAGSVERDGMPSEITVVSDDVGWCEQELSWLSEVAPVRWDVDSGPVEDFVTVSGARRAVISNSTFSYWAAHVGNVLHGDNHASIWAPRFFDRSQNGGRSWLLDERWSVIEDLPGGWDVPEDHLLRQAHPTGGDTA